MTGTRRRLVSSHEVAELLDISEQTVRKHTRQGRYPFAINLGTAQVPRWKYDLRRLEQWLERRTGSAA